MIHDSNFKAAHPLIDQLSSLLLLALFIFILVVPNSFRIVTIPLFFLLGFVCLFRGGSLHRDLVLVWLLGSTVTFFYLLVGLARSNPDAIMQVVFVYAVSPLIWILIFNYIFNTYNIRSILYILFLFTFIGALSVPLFIISFLIYGSESLTWLIAVPNVQFGNNYAGVTMHVLGSLSFVVAGFFSSPKIILNYFLRYGLATVLIVVVIISGRTALILSLFIGIAAFFVFSLFHNSIKLRSIVLYTIAIFILMLCVYSLSIALDLDVMMILNAHLDKILAAGGVERSVQADALAEGIFSSLLFGSGHGVSVDIIRNDEFPWRYELLLLATLYRVGVIGLIVYSLPVYFVFSGYFKNLRNDWLGLCNRFMLVGFISILIISATNPYLESFEFQWMLFGPFVYYTNIKR